MRIEVDREEDGRWLTEVPDLPGVMAYGATREEALARVKALALRVLADRLEHGESVPELLEVFSAPAGASGDPARRGSALRHPCPSARCAEDKRGAVCDDC